MGQQQRIRQRPHAARHRGDRRNDALRGFEIHVAQELVAHDVDADVDDHDPGREHLAGDQARLAGRDDQDLRVAGVAAEVASLGVEDADRAMLAQEQQRRRLADHVRTSDDDHALAGDLDPRTLQDLDRGLGRRRQEAVIAE